MRLIISDHMPNNAPSGENLNEVLSELRYLQNIYSQQYQLIENEIASYSMAIAAMQRNIQFLENAGKLTNSSILVSGEGGTYIEATVKNVKKVLTYVGAGYFVEKDTLVAKDFLKMNSQKQEESMKKLFAEKQKIEGELIDISYKLASIQQK